MRKWYCNIAIKILAVVIALLGVNYIAQGVTNLYDIIRSYETHVEGEPLEYNGFVAFHTFIDYYEVYRSEEYIKSGALVSEEAIDTMRTRFQERLSSEYNVLQMEYERKYSEVEDEEVLVLLQNEYLLAKQKLDAQVEQQVDNYRNSLIRSQLTEYSHTKDQYNELNTKYDFFMYLSDGSIRTNLNDELDARDSVAVIDHFNDLPMYDIYNIAYSEPYIFGFFVEDIPDTVSEVHIGIDQEYYTTYITKLQDQNYSLTNEQRSDLWKGSIFSFSIGGGLYALAALYLMIISGRTSNDDEIHFTVFDGLYMDLYTMITIVIAIVAFMVLAGNPSYIVQQLTKVELSNVVSAIVYVLGIYGLLYLTTLAKRIKTRTLFKHTMIYAACYKIVSMIRNQIIKVTYADEGVGKQIHGILAIIAGIMLVGIILIPGFLALLYGEEDLVLIIVCQSGVCLLVFIIFQRFLTQFVSDLQEIKKGTELIGKGNLSYSIPPLKNGSLNVIADNINSISDGLIKAIDDAVTSEKTKVELVANVSHDLRTPLTSIVNYIDLLSRDNVTAEESKHYIEVLQLKSHQLKKLVEDLFELTNIQNSQMEVELSEICIDDLINQTLAEYEEDFEKKELSIRITPLEQKSIIYADGNKMYRVLSNIFGNIVKYTLDSTRVYVTFDDLGDRLGVTFKNVANYEMNFDGAMMSERFIRGDKSRSSEGNGLGLAIAKSFLELQGDSLEVVNDGDLFKLTIFLHKKVEDKIEE